MKGPLAVLLLATGLACSDEDPYADLPPVQPLRDGSDDLQLVFDSWRGFGTSPFASLNGSAYLAIDGTRRHGYAPEPIVRELRALLAY